MRSVNLGVGENGIHPQYADILDYLWSRAIKTSITSNGRSIAVLPDAAVRRFHSVEFSLDFPTEHEHDRVRGPGNWRTVMESLERCTGLGVPTTTHGDLGNRASPRLLRPFRDMTALWIDHYPRVLHACCTFTGLSPDAVGWDVEPQREFAEFFPADFRDPSAVDQAK